LTTLVKIPDFMRSLLLALLLCLQQGLAHAADIYGYIDSKGVAHFASEKIDERYQIFFRGGQSFDTAQGISPLGRGGRKLDGRCRRRRRPARAVRGFAQLQDRQAALRDASNKHSIDYELLQALIATESGFDAQAVSPKGAMGLMQLMPATAQRYGVAADKRSTIEKKLFDPRINIAAGSRYLRDLIAMFPGQIELALAAYNAGEGAVQRAGNKIPNYKETQNYVQTVLQLYAYLKPSLCGGGGGGGGGRGGKTPGRIRMELVVPKGGALGRGNMPPDSPAGMPPCPTFPSSRGAGRGAKPRCPDAAARLSSSMKESFMQRRSFVLATAVCAVAGAARAQHAATHDTLPPAPSSTEPYARLQGGVPHHMTPEQEAQRVTDSPAPAGPAGRWVARAALPIPRSEMAWATAAHGPHACGRRLWRRRGQPRLPPHLRPVADRWLDGAPLPRGANHVAVAADEGRVYALGGFVEQNRRSDTNAYVYDIAANRWTAIAPLLRPRGAAAAVMLGGSLHLIGGASEPAAERASVGWHEVYDPKADRWTARKPLPGARDHVGCVSHGNQIHVIGGRFNTFEYNTDLHHVYLPALSH
jgi:hypothetical protein